MTPRPSAARRLRPLAAALALVLAAAPLAAQAPLPAVSAPPEFPATAVGAHARTFVDVLTSGDDGEIDAFVRGSLNADSLNGDFEHWRGFLRTVAAQSGGVAEVTRIDARGGEVSLVARTRRGPWMRAWMSLDPRRPDRLAGIGVARAPDPAETPRPWREGRLSEADVVAEIDAHARARSAADRFSGVVLVAKGDRVLYHQAFGMANQSDQVPNRPDTKFHIASMGKMFTALAIAQLVEAGKLRFTDTLANVLPDYPNPEAARKITIHHLLTHTAGIGDIFTPEFYRDRFRYREPRDYFPLFAPLPTRFEPGSRYEYSNAAFIVLGAIVERLSGQAYDDYVREHVFAPAGMTETAMYAINEVVPSLAVGYAHFDDPLQVEPRRSNWHFLGWKGTSAGGSYSTAPDLLRYARALRAGRIVSPAMVETLTTPKVTPNPANPAVGYGYGFQTRTLSGKSVRGHSGGGAPSGINADLEMVWEGDWTVIAMANYDAPAAQALARDIAAFVARQDP
ncbi:MAG TPA: serine hydrolase domain-containing protein [Longimicrobium sp.]|nr:serine hydrolase domain-containing protein [Longimicrobium sp.]